VLVGVKGAFASLTGFAALDPVCARCALAFIDGVDKPETRFPELSGGGLKVV